MPAGTDLANLTLQRVKLLPGGYNLYYAIFGSGSLLTCLIPCVLWLHAMDVMNIGLYMRSLQKQ